MDNGDATDQTTEVTPGQLRAARALLGWSRERAAHECGVGWATLGRLERDERTPRSATVDSIVRTLEAHGVRFLRDGSWAGAAKEDSETDMPPSA
jgi:DNA-binding XRE family transcriptional regulator